MENNEHILGIREIQRIYQLNDVQEKQLSLEIEKIESNMQVSTMSLEQCKRTENDMNIKGQDDDTLEEKRLRILTVENEKTPYTLKALKERLEAVIGKCKVEISVNGNTVRVRIALVSSKNINHVKALLEEIVPLDMLIDADVMWNSYEFLSMYTNKELKAYSHKELREKVFE